MPGELEYEPSELESREGVTYEPVIREHVPIPEAPIDYVPELDDPETCGPVKPETCDPILCLTEL